ncbi:hypothetical protein NADFUDRAFT_52704 [Nadsonia fulvescens var. elongata DSM 6958]|uniref:FAM192A/Fyv6 N-terminal domain-containing protein n=1 Tax=Nadsonia fulvescens var. elongata DSM 6958 TaxID=857566 RepID=A0A1E3PG22_9ASCO|nr:hypothetical protein NADFUDRAFT_52704 [Nadsonia fulvescens var. elongata DSM 6958]
MSSRFVKAGESADSFREDKFKAIREDLKSGANDVTPANRDKSLYEVLQENREKKQEAAEKEYQERNDIHMLGDDEIAYLDSLRVKQLNDDKAIRQEINDSLSQFHEQRQVNDLDENIDIIDNTKKFLPTKFLKKRKPGSIESSVAVVKKSKRVVNDKDVLKKSAPEISDPKDLKDLQTLQLSQSNSSLDLSSAESVEPVKPSSNATTRCTKNAISLKSQENSKLLSSLGDYRSDSDSD